MNYYIFDDKKTTNFYPLTHTRPTMEIRAGILKLRQKILSILDSEQTNIIISPHLKDIYKERHPDWNVNKLDDGISVFVNSRIKNFKDIPKLLENLTKNQKIVNMQGDVIAFMIDTKEAEIDSFSIEKLYQNLETIKEDKITLWEHTWEFVDEIAKLITQDYTDYFYDKDNLIVSEPGVTIINPYQVWLGDNVDIKAGVIIDATSGPVVIDDDATIMHNAVILGPAYIGKKSKIKVAAKIYEGTSIGRVCKVGGEVEETIIQAYSNKQHDGFLGHSYLGEWVNLGADTNNSDLKNNYKTVKVYSYPDKIKIDSKTQFMGTIIGDHSKTGINSTINTGAVIGVACNLYGKELISDFVPDFSWGEYNSLTNYKVEKFLQTADIVKSRRDLHLTENEKLLYKKIAKKELT